MKKISYYLLSVAFVFVFGMTSAQDVNNPRGIVQVYDISSDLTKNRYNQYYYENDTLIVSFLFWSSQGKMMLRIENKLSEPIYINWTKSMYHVAGISLPLTPYVELLSQKELAVYDAYKASEPTLTDMDYEWRRQMSQQEEKNRDQIVAIQPGSTYTKGNYYLIPREGFVMDTASPFRVEKNRGIKGRKERETNVFYATFTKDNSPIKFGISLVYFTAEKEGVTHTQSVMKQNFYVSGIHEMEALHFRGKQTGRTPEGFANFHFPERRSDRFYVEIDRRNSVSFNTGRR